MLLEKESLVKAVADVHMGARRGSDGRVSHGRQLIVMGSKHKRLDHGKSVQAPDGHDGRGDGILHKVPEEEEEAWSSG